MEVHHHPHVEKKNFKEYFSEFLMIFLAVTLGFIAESIRENITNSEHVKQLSRQLVSDLKSDTVNLRKDTQFLSGLISKNDSLVLLLENPLGKVDTKKLQQLLTDCYGTGLFTPSTGAIMAIQNEMHLKQFSNSNMANYLANYEAKENAIKVLSEVDLRIVTSALETFFKDHFTLTNMYSAFNGKSIINGQLRKISQNDLDQLGVQLVLIATVNSGLIKEQRKLVAMAVDLIHYVQATFHLENE
jgi:hypothetical protein